MKEYRNFCYGEDNSVLHVEVGDKLYYEDMELWHVIGFVKDGDEDLVILKSWNKYKGWWIYRVHEPWLFMEIAETRHQIVEGNNGIKKIKANNVRKNKGKIS